MWEKLVICNITNILYYSKLIYNNFNYIYLLEINQLSPLE